MLSHPVACQNQWRRLRLALRQQQKTMPHPCPNPALQNASHMIYFLFLHSKTTMNMPPRKPKIQKTTVLFWPNLFFEIFVSRSKPTTSPDFII